MNDPHQIATLLLFWDYDTQWGADRSRTAGGPKNWGPLEFVNTERLLDLHAQYDIKACFAVVGAAALPGERPYHDPEQVRRIHAAGHEIASHSLHHDYLPGLTREQLLDTLRTSKEILEQCIGAAVNTFVPPYNQPFEYPRKLAPAFSEWRYGGRRHINLPALCAALRESGYSFSRISYYPLLEYVAARLFNRYLHKPGQIEHISGLPCMRLNTPCGFATPTLSMMERCAASGQGITVAYAHPHSLHNGSPQDESYLIPFFERANELRQQGRLQVLLPSDLLQSGDL